jgi:hypothetical protein
MQDYVERQPYNVGFRVDGLNGESVFNIPIQSSTGNKDAFVLWVMDSGSQSTLAEVKGSGWITSEQIEWYNRESKAFTNANGGTPLPALAFYHIPVPEYADAIRSVTAQWTGYKLEGISCSAMNTGFFAATRINGDVMGHFCGHDHDNDFVIMWQGIMLGYCRFSGGNTTYTHLDYTGGRVFILQEGVRKFETYVRLRNGDCIQRVSYPQLLKKIED